MTNGFPSPKQLLGANLVGIRNLEGTLPAGVPQISGMLSAIAESSPDLPTLPLAAGAKPFGVPAVANLLKSVEGILPAGVPQLAASFGAQQPGAAGERPSRAKEVAAVKRTVI